MGFNFIFLKKKVMNLHPSHVIFAIEKCATFEQQVVLTYWNLFNFVFVLYYTQPQYLDILQETKCYLTHRTAQVQPNSQVTDIPLTERQRLKDEHLSTSLRFFSLPVGIGPDRGLHRGLPL